MAIHDTSRMVHLCDPNKHGKPEYLQIGCGAVGGPLALMIAKLGMKVHTCDNKKVQSHNVGNQLLFGPDDIGKYKSVVVQDRIVSGSSPELSGNCNIAPFEENSFPRGQIVGMSVDTMAARSTIYNVLRLAPIWYFIDTRITANHVIVFGVDPSDPVRMKRYKANLFPDSEAIEVRAACGAIIGVADVANIAAAFAHRLIIEQLNHRLEPKKVQKPPFMLQLNVQTWQIERND